MNDSATDQDKLLYLIAGKQKVLPEPQTTFAQSARLIADVANLTDSTAARLHQRLVYDGQDTGYPSEDVVNPSLGTYQDLMNLMRDSRRLNANVSVNVNYDDAYKGSPLFDPAFIAREPTGALWKSRAWDGEPAYIVTARRLTVECRQPHSVQVTAGRIVVDAPARTPIVVYASEPAHVGAA